MAKGKDTKGDKSKAGKDKNNSGKKPSKNEVKKKK